MIPQGWTTDGTELFGLVIERQQVTTDDWYWIGITLRTILNHDGYCCMYHTQ